MQSLVELRSLLLLSHEIITIKSEAIPRTVSQAVDGLYFIIYFAYAILVVESVQCGLFESAGG